MSKVKRILESTHAALHFPLGEVRQHNGTPSQEVQDLPWYRYVPKDRIDQLKWRYYVRVHGAEDKEFRHAIMQACEEDLLFACNTVLYVFEPRRQKSKNLPLNTWLDQDDHCVWLNECWGLRNCGTEKSRDLSLSWDHCIIAYHHWRFDAQSKIGFASLNEEKVDSPDDSDSLMWKLDFLHFNTPEWFRLDNRGQDILERTYFNHKFHNRQNGSTINGYASTGNLGRGGRKIAWVMDEFSEWAINDQQRALDSTQHSTKCRYFPSTFKNDSDRFFGMMRREQSTMLKLIADWKDNPWQKEGLYKSLGGKLEILDKSYQFPPDYPFILDGKTRSPYYDSKCKDAGATPQSIARELDRDPQGATSKVFASAVLQKARESCCDPYFIGNLDYNSTDLEPVWVPDPNGRMFVWKDLDEDKGQLGYGGPYALGCDIGTGAGSSDTSNSSLEVIDIATGEEVLQYYWHCIRPLDFAQLVYVVCKWLCAGNDFSWAYVNFESQGPGEPFRDEMVRLGWAHFYNTREESKIYQTRTEKLGHHNRDAGYAALLELQRGIQQDEVIIRSEKTVAECGEYESGGAHSRSGAKCVHVSSQASGDAASQGKAHGDCAIAMSLAWMAAKDRPIEKDEPEKQADPEDLWWKQMEEKLSKKAGAHALGAESFRGVA